MRRVHRAILGLVLATGSLVACGGDDDVDAGAADGDESVDAPDPAGDGGDDGGGDDGAAPADDGVVVDIGGETWELSLLTCDITDSGALAGTATVGEVAIGVEPEVFAEFRIQPEGAANQEPVSFENGHFFTLAGDGYDWNAGSSPFIASVTFDESFIDTWELDGGVASGQRASSTRRTPVTRSPNRSRAASRSTAGSDGGVVRLLNWRS